MQVGGALHNKSGNPIARTLSLRERVARGRVRVLNSRSLGPPSAPLGHLLPEKESPTTSFRTSFAKPVGGAIRFFAALILIGATVRLGSPIQPVQPVQP